MGPLDEGLLYVDKPVGPTSHDVVGRIRRITGIRRVGHTGTLDPLASGLLILCIGRATRLAEYLTARPKSYLATVRLGQVTTTFDGEGEIIADNPVVVSRDEVAAALARFRGEIQQIPPMHSAVKIAGQRLYRHARRGQEVDRPARSVTVHQIELRSWKPPLLEIELTCSSGTYVRSIAHDLGQDLGSGAYLAGLRRVAIGELTLDRAVPLDALQTDMWREHLERGDLAVAHLESVEVTREDARRLMNGQFTPRRQGQAPAALVRAYDPAGVFVGVLAGSGDRWRPRKIFYR